MTPNELERNMQLIRHLPAQSDCHTAVAIGNFDGLHLGHLAVIKAMKQAASDKKLLPTVLTFEPHPRRFFSPDIPAFRLDRLRDKLAHFKACGVERVAMPRFNAVFAQQSAEAFLEHILGRALGAKAVVTGEDFVFGHQRLGNSVMLNQWGKENGVKIITVPPVVVDGKICSSSTIRDEIMNKNLSVASRMLGRNHRISGRVVHGDGRGRGLGFPTANIALAAGILPPPNGVYAVYGEVSGEKYAGVANFGVRPTIGCYSQPMLEVHLFDFKQDIYGKRMIVSLVDYLRSEMKFDGLDALKVQIARDMAQAKQRFGG